MFTIVHALLISEMDIIDLVPLREEANEISFENARRFTGQKLQKI